MGLKVAAVISAVALGAAGAALAGAGFDDPRGDVRGGAGPDLLRVSVSHTPTTVTFAFTFAKAPPLQAAARDGVDMLILGIDVPPRTLKRTAFGWRGLDYYAGLHGTERTAIVVRAAPRKVVARPTVVVHGRTLRFSVARSALADPRWIEFAVAAGREGVDRAGGGSDEAPARGAFRYVLTR